MKKYKNITSFFKRTNTQSEEAPDEVQEKIRNNKESPKSTSIEKKISEVPSTTSASSDESEIKVGERPSDLGTLEEGPSQPCINFQKSQFGSRQRSFSSKHYEHHYWLEYSAQEDKVYCFVCRHFSSGNVREQNEKFIKSGFCNWKKLSDKLKKHDESDHHIKCSEKYVSYKHSLTSGNIQEKIITQHEEEVIRNRKYLSKLIDAILYLTRLGLPLRGHYENALSTNRGNFLEMSDLFANHDKDFRSQLQQHISYCSPLIQNELIDIISELTIQEIIKEVNLCGFFSIMVDEARCFKEEQLSIVIRYAKELEVEERFLGFINCSSFRCAQGLQKLILEFLRKCNLANMPIIAQSYDGASVMSGKNQGLQKKIKEIHPQAIYIHCLAHKLNLVVMDSCANIPSVIRFFNTIEALHIHFTNPGNHERLKIVRDALGLKSHPEIGSLSKTRWSCRYDNCKSVVNNYALIKQAIEEEINEASDRNSVEAIGILTCISKADFVISLFVLNSILCIVNVLSKYFQTKNATLGQANETITGTIDSLKINREKFDDIWNEIKTFAEKHDIDLEPARSSRKRKQPGKMKDYISDTFQGMHTPIELSEEKGVSEYWKINIYYPVIDNIIINFVDRFQNIPLADSVDKFMKLDLSNAKDFIANYKSVAKIDVSALKAEAVVLRNIIEKKSLEVNLSTLKDNINKDITANLYKMLQIAISLPISSAGCERSFSAMRRVKTWLRTAMSQDRFSSLSLINIENSLVKTHVKSDKVLDKFCEKNRKLKLV